MSAQPLCPACGSQKHRAYTKGKRRFRAEPLPGNVVSKGRACECGHLFVVLMVPLDTPAGLDLWRTTRP